MGKDSDDFRYLTRIFHLPFKQKKKSGSQVNSSKCVPVGDCRTDILLILCIVQFFRECEEMATSWEEPPWPSGSLLQRSFSSPYLDFVSPFSDGWFCILVDPSCTLTVPLPFPSLHQLASVAL